MVNNMNKQQIFKQEMQYIAAAIQQIRNVAHQHGMQDEHYDSNWMNSLDEMILKLRARDAEMYKLCSSTINTCN